MASESILAGLNVAAVPSRRLEAFALLPDYWALTKPDVNLLVAIAAALAYCAGAAASQVHLRWLPLLSVVLGTSLTAGGAAALNQWMERGFDSEMRRTSRRPVAAGRIEPTPAAIFGVLLALAGVLELWLAVSAIASLLAFATLCGYLFVYTPLKRRTPLCTLVGAIPGAMPVLIGYVAAAGKADTRAWLLYVILFLWQFPHFMAIAWMYREDYARAGYRVLPVKSRGRLVAWQTMLPAAGLLAVSGVASPWCVLLSAAFLYYGTALAFRRSNQAARRLLAASIVYLPAALLLVSLNR